MPGARPARSSGPRLCASPAGTKMWRKRSKRAQENARLALERKFEPARLNEAVLEGLQAFLGLSHLPRRLECFDISHGQGREVVASCVVFSDGVPDKARYRRFKMTNEQNDDFANMQEAVTRRYRRMKDEGQEFPNLVIIDGGLGQVNVAREVLDLAPEGLGFETVETEDRHMAARERAACDERRVAAKCQVARDLDDLSQLPPQQALPEH